MRTVVKAVFRSLSVSTATNASSLESQSRLDIAQQCRRKESAISGSLSLATTNGHDMSHHFEKKAKSLSPIYQLTGYEETGFEELQDKECDYYPNNSIRGDAYVLNMEVKAANNNNEQNVNSTNIMMALKNIRFVNSIVFDQHVSVFLTTVNYIQRLLHTKAVKKDLMQFISAAMYDLALEQRVGKALTKDQVAILLSLTNIPINHIEDFSRMKALLLKHLNNDLDSITIIDYLQILLKLDLSVDTENLPESHSHLLDIACILATSCELTHYTLACQALSLVNIAARHLSFDAAFLTQYAGTIDRFPIIFVSPVRLHQFAKLDSVVEENIKQCSESIVRYFAKYYDDNRRENGVKSKKKEVQNGSELVGLGILTEEEEEAKVEEEEEGCVLISGRRVETAELIEKLRKVRLVMNCQINGKQKQQHKRIKKKLSRQLKKCERSK